MCQKIAKDESVAPEVARLISEAEVYRKKDDPQGLESVRDVLARLEGKLREEYAITVVTVEVKGRKQNAILRYAPKNEGGQVSGYYLFVQARRADGTVIPERIRNAEKDVYEEVTTWAERVPEAVFERLKKDKQADGILNETAFGMKKRGFLEEEITMPGGDGKPLTRMGQITKW